jgi:hypothetical protein
MKISQIVFLVLISLSGVSLAQQVNTIGILPSVNINTKLPKDWFVNFKAESRQILVKDGFKYSYQLTDFSFAGGKKVGIRTTIAIGYLFGITNDGTVNRFIQQVSHVKQYQTFKLAHRLQTDQTFIKDISTEYRIRYRLSAEIPLSGQTLDVKEFFIKINNEYLNSLQGGDYDLEIRIAGYIGYVVSQKNKLEFGVDNRVDSFINDNMRNRFWLGLNFYQSF